MICCDCHEKIRADEEPLLLPDQRVLCEDCQAAILDKPVSGEKEGTQTGSKEWWV